MAKSYLSTKFDINLDISDIKLDGFLTGSEKMAFTDDGRTTDACVTTVALLCSSTKHS